MFESTLLSSSHMPKEQCESYDDYQYENKPLSIFELDGKVEYADRLDIASIASSPVCIQVSRQC